MTLRTYQAATMAEALAEVKRELGRDAVILHTRSYRKGGLLGIGGRRVWEVTASPNVNVPQRLPEGQYLAEQPVGDSEGRDTSAAEKTALTVPAAVKDAEAAGADQTPEEPLGEQVKAIRSMVESLLSRRPKDGLQAADMSPELGEFHTHLIEQDVSRDIAGEVIQQLCMDLTGQQLRDRALIRRELRRLLAGRLQTVDAGAEAAGVARPDGAVDRARVIALIGPTGVGKTTTIAKLAANYKLREGRKVGLITIDTYRIAAVDQLRTYAEIIELPLRAVLTAGELHQAVREMRDRDVVLIDTAGRSQNNRLRLSQLRGFLAAAHADEVHLVVSATGNQRWTRSVLERFLPLGANRLIVTKLDEAEAFGVFLNVAATGTGPLSYVTTGQDVPEDIAPAVADSLAECILTGSFGGEGDAL